MAFNLLLTAGHTILIAHTSINTRWFEFVKILQSSIKFLLRSCQILLRRLQCLGLILLLRSLVLNINRLCVDGVVPAGLVRGDGLVLPHDLPEAALLLPLAAHEPLTRPTPPGFLTIRAALAVCDSGSRQRSAGWVRARAANAVGVRRGPGAGAACR